MSNRRKVLEWVSRIKPLDNLCAEQIVSPSGTEAPTPAALLDQWGRAHWLRESTVIGREVQGTDFAVLETSVSRRHAALRFEANGGAWTASDLGSTNGTFVEGARLSEPAALEDGALVTIGDVGFVFHSNGAALFDRQGPDSIKRTSASDRAGDGPSVALLGPVMGGGGVVDCAGTYVQLGPTQYSLVTLLAERIVAEADKTDAVRGFVSSAQLLADLPWQTAYPEDNNVKQLVRRTRRAFDRAGIDNPIESRHGFGYRLRWVPSIEG
jgi:hypothetical protein